MKPWNIQSACDDMPPTRSYFAGLLATISSVLLVTCASSQSSQQGQQQLVNQAQQDQQFSQNQGQDFSQNQNQQFNQQSLQQNSQNQFAQNAEGINNFVEEEALDQSQSNLAMANAPIENAPIENAPTQNLPINNSQPLNIMPNTNLGMTEDVLDPSLQSPSAIPPANVALNANTAAPAPILPATPMPTKRVVDLGPPHGVLRWVGYNYRKEDRKLEVQIVTDGRPVYKIFQEVNRAKQPEIVVRFLNTDVRHKIRRDIDATEFRSPVAYIRMRRNKVFKHTDVILTMRDAVQPLFFAKGSNVMLTFDIPERWYGPQGEGQEPIARTEILPDANVTPVMDPSSDMVPTQPTSSIAVYVDDPGKTTFGGVASTEGAVLSPVTGSSELVPVADSSEASDVSVPTNQAFPPVQQEGQPANEVPFVPLDNTDKTEVRIEETKFTIAGVAQANFNYSSNIPEPIVNSVPMNGAGANILSTPDFDVTNAESVPVNASVPMPASDLMGVEQNSAAPAPGVSALPKKAMRFDFRNATIASVLRAIASESGLNFVMPPEISNQKVTVSLNNVSWDIALKAVLESNRLGMEEIGPGIVRIDSLKTFVDDRDAQEKAKQATEALIPTKVLVMRLSYADAEEASKMVAQMLPKASDPNNIAQKRNYDRFKVQVDKRSNSVIIEAIPTEIAKIKTLLERLDARTPQVKISSRIVEVIDTAAQALGINWGSPFNANAGRGTGFGSLPFPNSVSSDFAVDPAFAGTPVGAMRLQLGSINNATALELQLKMLESRTESETLQSQDILIEDNAEANIVAGSSDFFIIPATGQSETKLTEVTYNTSLKVRPHITADGAVQMKVEITGDSPAQNVKEGAAAGKTTRRLTTTLLKKSGDTAVIGGLYSTDKFKGVSGVPFLSKIPIFGALFRSTSTTDQKRDLLIMITPTIQSAVSTASDSGSTAPLENMTMYSNEGTNQSESAQGNVALNAQSQQFAPVQGNLVNANQQLNAQPQEQQQFQSNTNQQQVLSNQQGSFNQQGNANQQGNFAQDENFQQEGTLEVDDELDQEFE